MKVKVAYSGYDHRLGEVIEFEFDWDSMTNIPKEEANVVQIQYAIREAIYRETERKDPIAEFVILSGEPYDMIEDL